MMARAKKEGIQYCATLEGEYQVERFTFYDPIAHSKKKSCDVNTRSFEDCIRVTNPKVEDCLKLNKKQAPYSWDLCQEINRVCDKIICTEIRGRCFWQNRLEYYKLQGIEKIDSLCRHEKLPPANPRACLEAFFLESLSDTSFSTIELKAIWKKLMLTAKKSFKRRPQIG